MAESSAAVGPGPVVLTCLEDLVHYVDPETGRVAAVGFEFAEGFLDVQVDPDSDEANLSFGQSRPDRLVWWPEAAPHSVIETAPYKAARGLNSVWRWQLRNQLGYTDGFQIELGATDSPLIIQVVAAASALEVLLVHRLE